MKKPETSEKENDRRKFLKGVAAAGGAATVALAAGSAEAGEVSAGETDAQARGYRLTQHIEDYYKTAKM